MYYNYTAKLHKTTILCNNCGLEYFMKMFKNGSIVHFYYDFVEIRVYYYPMNSNKYTYYLYARSGCGVGYRVTAKEFRTRWPYIFSEIKNAMGIAKYKGV